MGNATNWGIFTFVMFFFIWLVLWVLLAWIAAMVAPDDRIGTFVGLTLLFGPVGVLAAAVASPRDPEYFIDEPPRRSIAKGRKRYRCTRCGAESDLHEPKDFECWRCGEKKYMVAD
jgi:hypothetical protein